MQDFEFIRTIHNEMLSIKVWIASSEEEADDIDTCIQSLVEDAEFHTGMARRLYMLFCSVTRVEVMDDSGCGESYSEG